MEPHRPRVCGSMGVMKPYRNLSGDSGVAGYELGRNFIGVRFRSGEEYRYEAGRIGRKHLDAMRQLAEAGKGLATYINAHPEVREGFGRGWEKSASGGERKVSREDAKGLRGREPYP